MLSRPDPASNPGAVGDSLLWETLVSEPGIGVAVVSVEGRILYVNEQSATIFLERPASDASGKLLGELFPTEWVRERMDLIHRVSTTGEPLVLRSIWRGRQIQSTFRLIDDSDDGGGDRVLIITRLGQTDPGGTDVVESEFAELGPLDVLTPKELEVLALLGQGLRLKDIAKILHRSPKTIDNHRTAIGRKLREADRVKLACLAHHAGLELSDAELKRIRMED